MANTTCKSTKPATSEYVNAVCVAVEDMGVMEPAFGKKPMVKFTFESDEVNGFGNKRRLTRLFHNHTHPLSAISQTVKTWCDRCLANEKEYLGAIDWESFVDKPACIKIEPGSVKNGEHYDNIAEILALNDDEVEKTACEPKKD